MDSGHIVAFCYLWLVSNQVDFVVELRVPVLEFKRQETYPISTLVVPLKFAADEGLGVTTLSVEWDDDGRWSRCRRVGIHVHGVTVEAVL